MNCSLPSRAGELPFLVRSGGGGEKRSHQLGKLWAAHLSSGGPGQPGIFQEESRLCREATRSPQDAGALGWQPGRSPVTGGGGCLQAFPVSSPVAWVVLQSCYCMGACHAKCCDCSATSPPLEIWASAGTGGCLRPQDLSAPRSTLLGLETASKLKYFSNFLS